MSKNVFRSGEIQFTPTKVHISPPVLSKRLQDIIGIQEVKEEPVRPAYTGPSPEELQRNLEEFQRRLEAERDETLDRAREEAQKIVKEAEDVAFNEVQRKGTQAQEAKAKAEAEAAELIKNAGEKAKAMIASAEAQVAEIEKNAYQRGLEDGRAEGWQEGKVEAERLIDRLHVIISKAIDRRNDLLTESEAQLVAMVLSISKKVVKVLTENQRNVVVNNVVQALRKLKSKSDVVIRVNIVDLKVATEHIKEIIARIERVGNVSVLEDATVDPGGCIIETDFGEIDARISSQLAEIEDKILEVSPIKTRTKEGD